LSEVLRVMRDNDPTSTAPSSDARYDALRSMMRDERNFQGQVFGWFLGLNGFLFAALGFSWQQAPDLVYVLGALGLLGAASWSSSTFVTSRAMMALTDRAETSTRERDAERPWVSQEDMRAVVPLPWQYWVAVRFFYPTRFLPILLGLAWAAVIVVRVTT
jgi:hypothetical protein